MFFILIQKKIVYWILFLYSRSFFVWLYIDALSFCSYPSLLNIRFVQSIKSWFTSISYQPISFICVCFKSNAFTRSCMVCTFDCDFVCAAVAVRATVILVGFCVLVAMVADALIAACCYVEITPPYISIAAYHWVFAPAPAIFSRIA